MSVSSDLKRRTKAALEGMGLVVEHTEHWLAFKGGGGCRKDFGGFADLIVWGGGSVFAVQVTTRANRASHLSKIYELDKARSWLNDGHRIELWLWSKAGKRWVYAREDLAKDPGDNPDRPPKAEKAGAYVKRDGYLRTDGKPQV